MWAIAKQTLKAAVRYRLVFVLAITLLIIVFGLPLIVKSDGTAKGLAQLVLTYTLGATTALLGLASLWMGLWNTRSRDRGQRHADGGS